MTGYLVERMYAVLFGVSLGGLVGCSAEVPELDEATQETFVRGTPVNTRDAVVAVMSDELCTGTLVKRRCVLTAAHCTNVTGVFQDTNLDLRPEQNLNPERWANVVRAKSMAEAPAVDATNDVQLVFLEPELDPVYVEYPRPGKARTTIDHLEHYTPVPMSFGRLPLHARVEMIGFGASQPMGGGTSVRSDEAPAALIKRGDGYTTESIGSGAVQGGDSGGPMLFDGTLYGVIQSGQKFTPTPTESLHTGLFQNPVERFITRELEHTCSPKWRVQGYPNEGTVTVSSNEKSKTCSDFEMCTLRNVRSEDGPVILNAQAPEGYVFVRWQGEFYGEERASMCPCHNSSSPSCTVELVEGVHEQEYAGYLCNAVFKRKPAQCGNGVVEEGEQCDGGSNCTAACTFPEEPPQTCRPECNAARDACTGNFFATGTTQEEVSAKWNTGVYDPCADDTCFWYCGS